MSTSNQIDPVKSGAVIDEPGAMGGEIPGADFIRETLEVTGIAAAINALSHGPAASSIPGVINEAGAINPLAGIQAAAPALMEGFSDVGKFLAKSVAQGPGAAADFMDYVAEMFGRQVATVGNANLTPNVLVAEGIDFINDLIKQYDEAGSPVIQNLTNNIQQGPQLQVPQQAISAPSGPGGGSSMG